MNVVIDLRLTLRERSTTVLVQGTELWVYGPETRTLLRHTPVENRELALAASLPAISAKDAALSWDGSHLLVADRLKRQVLRVDPANGQETLVVDPGTLAFGEFDTALAVKDAQIGDIAWYNGLLYLAVQAGYSSAIYGIDLDSQRVVSHRHAPGPKPSGLDFDPANGAMYTVDNRNRELRRFAQDGQVDVADLPSEWVEPRGLSLEPGRGLWSADWSTGDLLRIRVEG